MPVEDAMNREPDLRSLRYALTLTAADTAASQILARVGRPLPGIPPGALSTLNSSVETFRP